MKFEIIPTKAILYDKCENVEQLYDNFYYPLLVEYKELKKKYENAVADYETTMAEKNKLKKQLEENKDKINWYENFEINKTIDKLRIKHNNQQKEFIKYMNDCIKELEKESPNKFQNTINLGIIDITKTILQKYKEIIGVK